MSFRTAPLLLGLALLSSIVSAQDDKSAVETPAPAAPINVSDLVKRVQKAVVVVSFAGRDGKTEGLGTGFIIRPDGLIATNNHVIGEARRIFIRTQDGKTHAVESVVAFERDLDLALLKISAEELPTLELGDSSTLVQGQPVVAIGNPEGLEHSVVTGVVSGIRKEVDGREMIQLAIPIERGNSGGPLLDLEGRVHGLLTLKSLVTENLGYAVPVNALKPLIEKPSPIPMSRWLTIGRLSPSQWQPPADALWSQRAGVVRASGISDGFGGRSLCVSTHEPPKRPYEVAVTVRMDEADGAAGLIFHHDGERHYGFYPSSGRLRFARFDGPLVYDWKVLWDEPSQAYREGEWNRLKVRVEEGRFVCFVNGAQVYEHTPDKEGRDADTFKWKDGKPGLAKFRHTTAQYKQFVVAETIADETPSEEIQKLARDLSLHLQPDRPPVMKDVVAAAALKQNSRTLLEQEAARLQRQAQRVLQLSRAVHEERIRTQLKDSLTGEDAKIDLLRAALLVSVLDNPELDVDYYVSVVDELGRTAEPLIEKAATPADKLAAFHKFLFESEGFHGSRVSYDSPSNSYLNEVIDDREGLPITLSVLYMSLARRVGLNVEGVGLPGHFVVRYMPSEGDSHLVDVFNRGELLTVDEAKARVSQGRPGDWDDSFLDATPPAKIIERMFRNLIGVANRKSDAEAALRYIEAVLAIRPESQEDHVLKAVLCYQLGRYEDGLVAADWVLDNPSPVILVDRIKDLRSAIEARLQADQKNQPAD